ncbi:MAG: hypothetical protein MUO59_01945 [Actinobacteria bacterium]|nr:hypothetical protein [Actinomycetota bacterium]
MIKKKKLISILLAVMLFIAFNLLFVLNGCSNNKSDETGSEKEQADSSKGSNTYSEEEGNTLEDIYQRFLKSGRPSIIVFSIGTGCCASTKAFYDKYNDGVMELMDAYTGDFNVLFINTGILSEKDIGTAVEITSQNNALIIPSILILDKSGNAFDVIEGPFDEVEVKKVLDGMIND